VAMKLHKQLSVSDIPAPLRMVPWNYPDAPKLVAAKYNVGEKFANSCLIFSLK
jgi:hypothetical protein